MTEITIISANELLREDMPDTSWIVKHFIPVEGIAFIGGDSGTGKSFLALYISICCSLGLPFDTMAVQQCKVLYLDEENKRPAMKTRLKSLLKGKNLSAISLPKLYFSISNDIIFDKDGQKKLDNKIEEFKPNLIIIDSLVRFVDGNENDAKDMREVYSYLKKLITKHKCSFLILHHTIKGGGDKKFALRGSGDLVAFADVVMMISGDKNLRITQAKNRHEKPIEPMNYRLVEIQDGSIKIELSPVIVTKIPVVDIIIKDLTAWIIATPKERYTSNEIIFFMKQKGHKETSIKDAVSELVKKNVLKRISRGVYEYVIF